MGQEYAKPQPGKQLRVIGAGLSRTGTASFSRALEILLDGPVYHGGTQTTLGPAKEVQTWINVLKQWPPKDEAAQQSSLGLMRERLDGFVATTDSPCATLVNEMMELYPDAIVICTVRDPDAWVKSMAVVSGAATMGFLRIVLWPLMPLRYFVDYIDALRDQWVIKYGEAEPVTRKSWDTHIQLLKDHVPEDKLVFYDVREGWEPLCKALNMPVPEGVPFPNINDSQAIESFAQKHVQRGLTRWMLIMGVAGMVGWFLFA